MTTWMHGRMPQTIVTMVALLQAIALGGIALAEDAPAPVDPAKAPSTAAAPAADAPKPRAAWVDATNDLAGNTWGADGVTAMAVVPGADVVVVGVSGKGLYASTNKGSSWTALGAIANPKIHPSQVLIDAKDANAWWVASSVGAPGLFTSADGGKTFKGVGNVEGLDSIAVDLADPKRKTLVLGPHEKEHEIQFSTNGGSFFSKNGKFPPATGYTDQVALVDEKTWLVSSSRYDKKSKKEKEVGIWRTDDAGKTWAKVYTNGGTAPALVTSNGTIYWPAGDGEVVLRSTSHGKSWESLPTSVKSCPVELPKRWLAALGDQQLLISNDGGESWDAVGQKLSFQPKGLVYDEKGNCFFAWRSTESHQAEAIVRLDVPENLDQVVNQLIPRDILAWDGEAKPVIGGSWANKDATITVQSTVVRQGKSAILWHAAMKESWANCGWSWFPDPRKDVDVTDASGCATFLASIKITGDTKPKKLQMWLGSQDSSSAPKQTSKDVDVLAFCPKLLDGEWHEVQIPLSAFDIAGLDRKKLCSISFKGDNFPNPLSFDFAIDYIGFAK